MISRPLPPGDNNVQAFLDTRLLESAREAARGLMQSGEARTIIPGLDQDTVSEFHVMRDLQAGFMPVGKVKVDGVVFYICGETGTVPTDG